MRALVIDDSRTARILISNTLKELGMSVVQAADGREALEQLQKVPDVDLMLVDWNMPVMNGFEFVRAVRADPSYRDLRLVMVTTETEVSQVATALEAGADEYIMKPFSREILVD